MTSRELLEDEQRALDKLGHGEPERCACIAHVLAQRLAAARAFQGCDAETALEAVQGDVSFFALRDDTQDRVDAALSSPAQGGKG